MQTVTTENAHIPKTFGSDIYNEAASRFLADMTWRKLHALMELDEFSFEYSYIKTRLNISETEYKEALEGLEKLGLVAEVNEKWQIVTHTYTIPTQNIDPAGQLANHEIFMSDLSGLLSLQRKSQWASGMVASNKELVSKLQKNILNAFIEFNEESAKAQKDGLYGIGFTATDLLEPQGDN